MIDHYNFGKYEYLWPPRPQNAIPSALINMYQKMGYVLQLKRNGTCSLIYVTPDKKLITMSRHNDEHKAWKPTDKSSDAFLKVPGTGWFVFVAELLNNKVPGIRDKLYIFDILVNDGVYLIGKTQQERNEMLQKLFTIQSETEFTYEVDDNVSIAKNYNKPNFLEVFDNLSNPEDEGIVLKDPNAKLGFCSKQLSNSKSMVKCRKSKKNYSF